MDDDKYIRITKEMYDQLKEYKNMYDESNK